ncbi:MAG: ABC transporter ATP-binding protein [Parasporobacterium sp.]|nr:ABC transporter ATP-binding protein [Parasporobacterium sp.]
MLEIKNLDVIFGKSVAIHDINISIPEGKIVTLIGSNGAGKSTTLNAIAGIVKPARGQITYMGEDITSLQTAKRVRKGLCLVPEGRHLFPFLSVYENLQLGATQRKDTAGIKDDLDFIYNLFPKLKDRRSQKAGTLSGGEQQMVAIARGLMSDPKLLCLDEPSLGIAPIVIEEMGVAIKEINKTKGTSILLVEQNVHLAFSTAQYCYALQVGQLMAEGDIETVKNSDIVKRAYFGGDKEN